MSETVSLWIDNAPCSTQSTAPLVHPNTAQTVYNVHTAGADDVDRAVASAHKALPGWAATPAAQRRKILNKAAQLLREREAEFIKTWQSEMDVHEGFAGFNVQTSAGMIEELAAGISTAIQGDIPQAANYQDVLTLVSREPLGVCLALCPFNAALILSIRGIATPLAAGNTVVVRTSEMVYKTQYMWGPIFAEAGLPPGCLNIVHTKREETPERTKQLIYDKRIRHVSFTGSTGVGKHIGRMAGEALKPCILELGGKAPVLVLSDADPQVAANNALFHTFLNSGQICMSTERIIVSEKIRPAFVEAVKKQHPSGKTCQLASALSAKKIRSLVDDALKQGAALVGGSDVWPPSDEDLAKGHFPAVVLDQVSQSMEIWKEETFGPIAIIVGASGTSQDAEDANMIELANDSDFGLAASVFSNDVPRAIRIGRSLESGLVRINAGTVADDPTVPFGGYKSSGFGRFNGVEAIRAYTQTKAMSIPLRGLHMLPIH